MESEDNLGGSHGSLGELNSVSPSTKYVGPRD